MCERFGCLPSALYEEDVELLQLMAIIDRGSPEDPDDEYTIEDEEE